MKGLTKKDIPILVLCLSAVLLVAVYCFVFLNGKEKLAQLEEKNSVLETELSQLREKAGNRQYYQDETALMKEEIDMIYRRFPADVLFEDGIISALELEEDAPMISQGIGYSPATDLYTVGQGGPAADTSGSIADSQDNLQDGESTSLEEDVEAAQEGNATVYSDEERVEFASAQLPSGYMGEYGPITLRNTIFTYNFTTSYAGLKNIVDYFVNLPGRATLANISLGYDSSTGLLNGTTTVNRYSLTGTGAIYEPPVFPAVATGKPNIFGALELYNGEGSESGEEENEESAQTEEEAAE